MKPVFIQSWTIPRKNLRSANLPLAKPSKWWPWKCRDFYPPKTHSTRNNDAFTHCDISHISPNTLHQKYSGSLKSFMFYFYFYFIGKAAPALVHIWGCLAYRHKGRVLLLFLSGLGVISRSQWLSEFSFLLCSDPVDFQLFILCVVWIGYKNHVQFVFFVHCAGVLLLFLCFLLSVHTLVLLCVSVWRLHLWRDILDELSLCSRL